MSYAIAAVSPNLDVANAAVPAYGVINLFFACEQQVAMHPDSGDA